MRPAAMNTVSASSAPLPFFHDQDRDAGAGENDGPPEGPRAPPPVCHPGSRLMKYIAGVAPRLGRRRHLESLPVQKPRALAEQELAQFTGIDHILRRDERFIVGSRVIVHQGQSAVSKG